MRTPARPTTPEDAERRRRNRRIGIVVGIVIAAVVVGSVLAYVLLQPGPPLDLRSVSLSPDPPAPGQPVRVTAEVQGGTFLAPLSVGVWYTTFFGTGSSGSSTLFHRSGDTYSADIGPFDNGTATWILVTASDGRQVQLSSNLTVEVGSVSQGGAGGIQIHSVVLSPAQPTSLDSPTLTVNVTSSAPVTDVSLSTQFIYVGSGLTSSGGGSGSMGRDADGNYTAFPGMFFGMGPSPYGTTVGTIWLYRFGVQDAAGHALLSPVYTFTVAAPPL